MAEIAFKELQTQLKSKKYKPIYLLQGEESFFIDAISDTIEQTVLSEDERAFNQTIIYGQDTDVSALVGMVKRFPMLSQHQVVIVKEAQQLKNIEHLEVYCAKPLVSTILVLCYKNGTIDKRKKIFKALMDNGLVLNSEKIKDYNTPRWIEEYVATIALKMNSESSQLLADFLGNDLTKISNELKKIKINLPQNAEITTSVIEKYVGIDRNYNVFELQRAITVRDKAKAFEIVNYFAKSPKAANFAIQPCIGLLYTYFSKIYQLYHLEDKSTQNLTKLFNTGSQYIIKSYIQAAQYYSYKQTQNAIFLLLEYDLKSKGVASANVEEGELLKELVFKIMRQQ